MPDWRIIEGDCRDVLATLPERSAHTCVTSPPYFGLRDYGHDGQIGLEPTPDEFVAALVDVFRGVRRVLRDDGTVWLNLGDSYAGVGAQTGGTNSKETGRRAERMFANSYRSVPDGVKAKDLLGIPWAVAQALRAPYYDGEIKAERDRVWLAATLDAEGSISGFTHARADDGSTRTGVHVTITNTIERLLNEADRIWPASRVEHENHGAGHYGSRPSWRWVAHGAERKALLMRELYPYLIAKREQARLAYAFFLLSIDAKRLGHSPQRDATRDRRAWIVDALSRLNRGEGVDVPSWIGEPPSVGEPGWYLRSDIIWSKPNPMPESVTDRPTKSHEFVFLLSKGPRYYWDADAIREDGKPESAARYDYAFGAGPKGSTALDVSANGLDRRTVPIGEREFDGRRNKRSVWTVATQPYAGAHFATFPPKLIEPCILAGAPERACGECGAPWVRVVEKEVLQTGPGRAHIGGGPESSVGDNGWTDVPRASLNVRTLGFEPSCSHEDGSAAGVVLDPFAGAGTTLMVAAHHRRDSIGIELSPAYAQMARERIRTALDPHGTVAEWLGQGDLFGDAA